MQLFEDTIHESSSSTSLTADQLIAVEGKVSRFDSGNILHLTNADSSDSDLSPGIIND